jgi:hypothetical protein
VAPSGDLVEFEGAAALAVGVGSDADGGAVPFSFIREFYSRFLPGASVLFLPKGHKIVVRNDSAPAFSKFKDFHIPSFIGHQRIIRTVHDQYGHGLFGIAFGQVVLRQGGGEYGPAPENIRPVAKQAGRHESTVRHPGGENPVGVDGVGFFQSLHDFCYKADIVYVLVFRFQVLGAAVVPVFVDRIGIDDDEAFPVGDPVKTAIGKPGRSFARSAPAVQVKKGWAKDRSFFLQEGDEANRSVRDFAR